MNKYFLYGWVIESDLDFPQLEICENTDSPSDILIVSGEIPSVVYESEAKDKWCSFSEKECWLINLSMYIWVEDGNKIVYKLKEGSKYHRTYLLGWGMSMICLQRKSPAIHCSAITDGKYAYLIAGESGSGKSTITNLMLNKGYKFLADDIIRVELDENGVPIAKACFPYRKLCRDAALNSGYDLDKLIYIDEDKDKFLVPSHERFFSKPIPVKSLFVLYKSTSETVNVTEMNGLDRVNAVLNNLFLRHLLNEYKVNPFVTQPCLKIASKINCSYIGRPTEKDTVDEILQTIESLIN